MNKETIEVTVKIPGSLLAKFYQLVGGLLAEEEGKVCESNHEANAGELSEWMKNDQELATKHWSQLSEPAQKLYEILSQAPGKKFSGVKLAEKIGLQNAHGVTGLTAWPGRYAYAVGRKLPMCWEKTQDGLGYYWMKDEVAQLFVKAKEANTR
jgi:hypothetical protein